MKFDPDKPNDSKEKGIENKIPEYNFEEGVEIALEKILELMNNLKRNVYVTINGSGNDVGKSYLFNALGKKLLPLGIKVTPVGFSNPPDEKIVFINTAEILLCKEGSNYREDRMARSPNAPVGEIPDLYIGIYRPGKEFEKSTIGGQKLSPVADILIRNEGAKDDPNKFQNQKK